MSIGSMAGYCEKHKMDKMFVGTQESTEPTCIKCDAEARPKMGRTQIVEDPGEGYFQGKGGNANITLLENVPTVSSDRAIQIPRNLGRVLTLEEVVAKAVEDLNSLPMPKDIKQFKAVQKAIKTLQALVEKQNG